MKLISKLLLILLGCSSCDPNTHEFGFEVYNQSDREIDVCLNMWYLGIQDILVPAYQDYDATSQYNYGFTTVEKKSVNLFITFCAKSMALSISSSIKGSNVSANLQIFQDAMLG